MQLGGTVAAAAAPVKPAGVEPWLLKFPPPCAPASPSAVAIARVRQPSAPAGSSITKAAQQAPTRLPHVAPAANTTTSHTKAPPGLELRLALLPAGGSRLPAPAPAPGAAAAPAPSNAAGALTWRGRATSGIVAPSHKGRGAPDPRHPALERCATPPPPSRDPPGGGATDGRAGSTRRRLPGLVLSGEAPTPSPMRGAVAALRAPSPALRPPAEPHPASVLPAPPAARPTQAPVPRLPTLWLGSARTDAARAVAPHTARSHAVCAPLATPKPARGPALTARPTWGTGSNKPAPSAAAALPSSPRTPTATRRGRTTHRLSRSQPALALPSVPVADPSLRPPATARVSGRGGSGSSRGAQPQPLSARVGGAQVAAEGAATAAARRKAAAQAAAAASRLLAQRFAAGSRGR